MIKTQSKAPSSDCDRNHNEIKMASKRGGIIMPLEHLRQGQPDFSNDGNHDDDPHNDLGCISMHPYLYENERNAIRQHSHTLS
jgi:hypothetical protein